MIVKLRCPDCNSNITVGFKTDDQFANVCELHVCRKCYGKFRIVLDLLRCLGCSGQGALNQCGVSIRIYVDEYGRVINGEDAYKRIVQ